MSNFILHNNQKIGVGDIIRVFSTVSEKGKERIQIFEGQLIAIKGRIPAKTITVYRTGDLQIGIERIFSLDSPVIKKIEVVKKGLAGVKKAKLYYLRSKSKKEAGKIYSRVLRRKSE